MTSIDELLHEVRRIEEHRATLTNKKIKSIYTSLEKDLNAFVGSQYVLYADEEGKLFLSYLDSKSKRAKFLEEMARNVDSISPQVKQQILDLVDKTYEKSYKGMVNAVKNSTDTKKLLSATDTLVSPEVLKRAVENNIDKLTLNAVMEKHRAEIIADIQQTLTLGLMNGDRYETMAKRIQERLGVSYSKASNIARTESHRNTEAGLMDGAKETAKIIEQDGELIYAATWKTMQDERVRPQVVRKTKKGWKRGYSNNGANHMKMHNVTIKVGDKFQLETGVFAECPSMSGTARNDCNCRCYLSYSLMTVEEFERATGKKTKKAQQKPTQRVELSLDDFPAEFTKGAEGKNTRKLIDFVNGIEGADPNVLRLYASTGKLENLTSNGIPFKISHAKGNSVGVASRRFTGEITEVKYTVPRFKGDNIAGQVNTTLHEQMHLIDLYGREDIRTSSDWFSVRDTDLVDAFRKTSSSISDEISGLFDDFNKQCKQIKINVIDEYMQKREELREKYLPNGMSPWEDMAAYRKFEKESKRLMKSRNEQIDYEQRNALGGGIGNLQDIYDALSGGTYSANGTVIYGHGQAYYSLTERRIMETIANYTSLSVTRPDLIDMLRRDKPELCKALDGTIEKLLKIVEE